jgi:HEAT repeats
MSLALIEESAKEVRRLAIAGSPLAVGDFRLKKLIAPLEQAGAKVPVFAQVARSIGDLVNGTDTDSAANLLSLSTLLNAILYTQGHWGTDGDFHELEGLAANGWSTRTTARVLKPLIQALTTSGAGRLETVKAACERGAFNDLRLVEPAIQALGDSYPEVADLVAEKILPGYGPGIVPRLKACFDVKGAKQEARKLTLMHRLDPAGTVALCNTALEDGSPEVKAAALGCLGQHEDCLPLVLAQANAKNKLVRAAALEALAAHDRPEISRLFNDLVKGKALDILVRPFRAMRNRQVLNSLLAEGQRVYALVLNGDAEQMPRFLEILECLKERKDPETEEFVLSCFNQSEKLGKLKAPKPSQFVAACGGADLMSRMAWLLCEIGTPRGLEAVVAKRDVLPPIAFNQVLQSALRVWPAERVYEEFSPLLGFAKGPGKERSQVLLHTIRATCDGYVSEWEYPGAVAVAAGAESLPRVQWDPRWVDAAIKANEPVIVCCLATPGHAGAVNYLLKAMQDKGQTQTGLLVRALARCQYPGVTEAFLSLVEKKAKAAKYFDYELQLLFQSARHLPAADLPKLDAFAAKLDEKFVDNYLEALAPLRSDQSDPSDKPEP